MVPSISAYNAVIACAEKLGKVKSLVPLLQEMESLDIDSNAVTYNIAMRALARKNDWGKAWDLVDEMVDKGIQPTVHTFTTMISCCESSHNAEQAMIFLDEMDRLNIEADIVAYNAALKVCLEHHPEEALEVLSRMDSLGLKGDKTTIWVLYKVRELHGQSLSSTQLHQIETLLETQKRFDRGNGKSYRTNRNGRYEKGRNGGRWSDYRVRP